MSPSLLLFGFLLGLKHALEADHVAAVATLAIRSSALRDHAALAGLWGLGHAGALLVFGTGIVALGLALPVSVVNGLEGLAGLVLVGLGLDVLRRLRHDRVHLHAHAHAGETAHDPAHHEHRHPRALGLRALAVGGVHGLAGSATLVILAADATRSLTEAVAYLALFGAGTIAGMMTVSLAISVPLRLSARGLGRFQHGLQGGLATATIALGASIALRTLAPP
jgi:sulfite exporter TauE/SafE